MSITMPDELQTALRLLGLANGTALKIFDVDEDKLSDFASWVKDAITLVQDEYTLVESIFRELGDNATDTASYKDVADAVEDLNDFLEPILSFITDGIETAMPVIHDRIVEVKLAVLGIITANAAPLLGAIASGVGIPLALVGKNAMKLVINELVDLAAEEFVHYLVGEVTDIIDSQLLTEENQDKWAQKVADLTSAVAAVGVVTSPAGVASGVGLAVFNDHDIVQHATKLAFTFHDFKSSLEDWSGIKDEMTDLSHRPGERSLWLVALKDLLDWVVDKLKAFGLTLMKATIDSLVELIEAVGETLLDVGDKTKTKLSEMIAELEVYLSRTGALNPVEPIPGTVMQLIVQDSRAMGQGTSDADDPDKMRLPVGDSKPIGTVGERPNIDLGKLDLPVTESRPIGTAHSDAGKGKPMDVDVKQL